MKRLLFCLIILTSVANSFAQDLIVLLDASEIEAKVIMVGTSEITYKKWDFQDGPSYQIAKSDVFYIKYANGTKDVFAVVQKSEKEKSHSDRQKDSRVLFNAYAEMGCTFAAYEAGPSLSVAAGARIYDYAFVGLSFGSEAPFGTRGYYGLDAVEFPLMVDLRGYLPTKTSFYPFMEFAFGVDFLDDFSYTQYYYLYPAVCAKIRLMLGLEYKRIVFGMGYNCMTFGGGASAHFGYAKVGVRIGRLK